MEANKLFKEVNLTTLKSIQYNYLPYYLENLHPKAEVFFTSLKDIAFIYFVNHRLIKWVDITAIADLRAKIETSYAEKRFDQDTLLNLLLPGKPELFPGKPCHGSIGCNITQLQALEARRKLNSEKEYLPFHSKKDLGQYDTPYWLAKQAVANAYSYSKNFFDSIIDPMAGEGAYLEAAFHISLLDLIRELKFTNIKSLSLNISKSISKYVPKLVGIEIDKNRVNLLNKNFKNILKAHGLPVYDVGHFGDYFSIGKSKLKGSYLIVSNPCWDVIETTNTVRSRSKSNKLNANTKSDTLLKQRNDIVSTFNSQFKSEVSLKDARNIYTLALMHTMTISNFKNPISFIVPKGILGDKGTNEIRKVIRKNGSEVLIEEFKNKASNTRIFSAVDPRVQFCILTIGPKERKSHGVKVKAHEWDFCNSTNFITIPWSFIASATGKTEAWLVVKDLTEIDILKKMSSFPRLSDHLGIEIFAGRTSNKGKYCYEGRDIEMFRLRKFTFSEKQENNSPCVFVRKILPNGGKKLIAAPSPSLAPISDSLLCINAADQNYTYYLSGVFNSLLGEFRLRAFQSNINLNLWKLLDFQVPVYDSSSKLHSDIIQLAKKLEKKSAKREYERLNKLVGKLFSIQPKDLDTIAERTRFEIKEAA